MKLASVLSLFLPFESTASVTVSDPVIRRSIATESDPLRKATTETSNLVRRTATDSNVIRR